MCDVKLLKAHFELTMLKAHFVYYVFLVITFTYLNASQF